MYRKHISEIFRLTNSKYLITDYHRNNGSKENIGRSADQASRTNEVGKKYYGIENPIR